MDFTRESLLNFIGLWENINVDRPFNNPKYHNYIIFDVLRHNDTKKIFGLVYYKNERLYLDLKYIPQKIDELIESSKYILPGQHFNKSYWITLDLAVANSRKELMHLINVSYQLTSK